MDDDNQFFPHRSEGWMRSSQVVVNGACYVQGESARRLLEFVRRPAGPVFKDYLLDPDPYFL